MKSEKNGILDCRKGFETGGNSRFTARCAGKIIALMLVLSFMLSLLPLGAAEVFAASEGGYTYEVSDGKATITGMDESTAVGDISIPPELGGYPVTAIGKEAFYSCDALTSVIIPDGVTEIGEEAFSKCYKLASITLPDSVTEIGRSAFFFCSSLTSITLPEGVTTIGNYVFSSCIILDEIEVSPENPNYTSADGVLFTKDMKTLIQYPEGKSNSEYAIPDGVTTIGDNAFFSCDFLTSVTIPDSVKTIGDRAFYLCTALLSITIPDSVTVIGKSTFAFCKALTSITISDSVNTIGAMAFCSCKSLTSVTIPHGVATIGYKAFSDCDALISVTIPDSVTTIGDSAFYLCAALRSITIPDSVVNIGEGTFSQCPNLTVKCTEGSYAQEYLERNDISFTYLTSDTDMSFFVV